MSLEVAMGQATYVQRRGAIYHYRLRRRCWARGTIATMCLAVLLKTPYHPPLDERERWR